VTTGESTRSVSKVAAVATAAALVALLSILGTWAAQSYFATINRAEERAVASSQAMCLGSIRWVRRRLAGLTMHFA
jgi:hypothetical protein